MYTCANSPHAASSISILVAGQALSTRLAHLILPDPIGDTADPSDPSEPSDPLPSLAVLAQQEVNMHVRRVGSPAKSTHRTDHRRRGERDRGGGGSDASHSPPRLQGAPRAARGAGAGAGRADAATAGLRAGGRGQSRPAQAAARENKLIRENKRAAVPGAGSGLPTSVFFCFPPPPHAKKKRLFSRHD
jgi:hypothetical protein